MQKVREWLRHPTSESCPGMSGNKEGPTMKRQTMTGISLMLAMLALVLPATLLWPLEVNAQSMSDYTATPPFVSNTVPANILLLLDNSGSMNYMAYTTAFNTATTYSGMFDATECYSYSSSVFQPDPSANPAT